MRIKAAVLWERRTPLRVEDVEIADPAPGEARVKILASGVCHSDLHHIRRETAFVPPLVLGHEGAGVVESVGEGVTRVQPGDRVIIAFGQKCGTCYFCLRGEHHLCAAPGPSNVRLRHGDQVLTPLLAVGSFAEYANVDARNLVKIPDEMPIDRAALIACGVTTGLGAVIKTARVEPGSNVAVIGVGGVGLNVVQGAALAGATRVIAIDLVDRKLEMAREFGATHTINPNREDPIEAVRSLTGGWGVDYAFEVIGHPATIRQAYDMTRKGGKAVVVGLADGADEVSIPAQDLMRSGKSLVGCFYGSVSPYQDIPRYVDLYLNRRIKLDELISRRFALDEINEAIRALDAGEVARGVIVFE
ncbi:Zn-dependent alcohol dehydrogenase [Sphaerobacter thermophilus]|uniref:Alcohol dehydrogenase zinc-binding domain protein n=1 Tax=Sphaerobacter thermophilus (strain ATCC 49802 / DSM 20745 / KCCM 41009 / NCIMB 13125 / S 6022) TaxID=479434 RepID=D1CAE2_SPHTD|nr:Zn-dependent alcohol dehydrogenase [Sphaerobacter thermophilus]ACZ40785.1 Alcohol dehydrogenase zinc-binding domain protein [Sphaerobacter thermophilus DSM 20745]